MKNSHRFPSVSFACLLPACLWAGQEPLPAVQASDESAQIATLDSDTSPAMPCEMLAAEDFNGIREAPTSIFSAEVAEGGAEGIERHCVVKGVIQPQIQFEMRLPMDGWNGRYFQTGCGVFCGVVQVMHPERCLDALAGGFAVAAHNMGHVGQLFEDPVWGASHDLRVDYGKRSTHVMAVVGKVIAATYYGSQPNKSYFRGCSTGGREALSEAQHYPGDFDGIVAGDPAFAARLGGIANNWDARELIRPDGSPRFDRESLTILHQAVMEACDGLDGVRDGILMDPRRCRFDIEALRCGGDGDGACLSDERIEAAKRLYEGPKDSRGRRLMPGGINYGSELSWGGRNGSSLTTGYLRYLAFEGRTDPAYSHRDFDFDRDMPLLEKMAALYDPVAPYTAPDLSGFERQGGKLILYHGWADGGVAPEATLDYYAQVLHRQGGLQQVQSWFRVFMVPGMFHCRGGDAPNRFDLLSDIVRWVEQDVPPDRVIATQYEGQSIKRTRPLFPYPAYAAYTGEGDVNDERNWIRADPDTVPDDRIDWLWAPRE